MATATQERTAPKTIPNTGLWMIGLAALVIIGIAAWVTQLTRGMSVIGTGQEIVWGVYIVTFFALAGIAGGLAILTALSDLQIVPGLQPHRRSLLLGAVACYVASGVMILMDIGKPFRVLNMILSPNLSSPFVWDFTSLALGMIVVLGLLFAGSKMKWLSTLAGILAAMVVVIEGWILSMSAGGPLWHGGMTSAVFLVESLITATSILLIARSDPKVTNSLRRFLLVLLLSFFLFNLFEVTALLYAGHTEAQAATRLVVGNPLFWIVLVMGIGLPFVLLSGFVKSRTMVVLAAVLALLGVVGAKYVTLISGQALPFMLPQATYNPTLVEIGGVVGISRAGGPAVPPR